MTGWHIAVLLPARNEEVLLPRCLDSIAAARQRLPRGVTSDVVVACDASTDRTFALARRMLNRRGFTLECDYKCVGRARFAAVNAAIDRYRGPLNRCWLANTDADCIVPENWLVDQLVLAQQGIAAMAGIVEVDSFAEHEERVCGLFRETYLIHADETHPHVHGANLGVRADAYLDVGGWSDLETAEDHDLWSRLALFGYTRRSDARLSVVTSGRRVGRAPFGFAAALAAHNEVTV